MRDSVVFGRTNEKLSRSVDMEENIEKSSEKQINLGAVLVILKRNIIIIVLVTALFAVGSYLFSKFFIQKQYSASAVLIVNNISNDKTAYSTTEITAAQDLAEVYSIMIKSNRILQEVIDNQHLNMTVPQLSKYISVSTINNTQAIRIRMTHSDAEFAKKVVAEIVVVAKPVMKEVFEAVSVNTLDDAIIDNNGNPVSPNLRKNTLIGALVGLALVLLFVFLKHLINNKFMTEEDVVKTLGVPLIGIIPEVDGKEFRKS